MITVLGLNHKTASLEIREKFVFCEEDIKRSKSWLSGSLTKGLIIVSTCNRTEFYLHTPISQSDKAIADFIEQLSNNRKFTSSTQNYFYQKSGTDAIRHLFRVATGLNSMALGEYQIVSQLKTALSLSQQHQICSPVLIRLFNKAFEASKKARTTTGLNKGAVSVSYAAVEVVSKTLKNLNQKSILLIGAGETGELTIQSLMKRGCRNFTITNRTFENAQTLAQKYQAKAKDIKQLKTLLAQNDIIVTSTASKNALITKEMAENALMQRQAQQQVYIDLSVPRNVEQSVDSIEDIEVYNMDKLNAIIENNYQDRKNKVAKAEKIIESVVLDFESWNQSRGLSDAFKNINRQIKLIKRAQLIEFSKYHKNEDLNNVSQFGDLITNKLARLMIQNIKSITDNGKKEAYVEMINELFTPTQNESE